MPDFALPDFAAPVTGLPPLVLLGAAAVLAAIISGMVGRRLPWTGRTLRTFANLALIGVLVLTGLRFIRLDPEFDAAMSQIGLSQFGMPVQSVSGGETRVPLSADGHFWIEAKVQGSQQRFMVDTGATISALSTDAARAAGVRADPLGMPVIVRTANGPAQAQMARVSDLRFGNIVAADLDTIITADTGGLNVLGMNFLSRLKGWRVEDGVLILTPRNAAPG